MAGWLGSDFRPGRHHRRQAFVVLVITGVVIVAVATILLSLVFRHHQPPSKLAENFFVLIWPIGISAPVVATLMLYGWLADRKFIAGRCPRCGYDVASVQAALGGERRGAKCPECGAGV